MPTSDERREWRADAEHHAGYLSGYRSRRLLALLDALDAAEERLVAVAALAEKWEAADGEPVSTEGLTALNVTNRRGRELRHILDNPAAALASVKAEALREAAEAADVRGSGVREDTGDWLRDRADRIEGDHV